MAAFNTTLPASWFTSKAVYNLERRAIFLKSWFLLGAVSKWPDIGDYKYEMAQVNYTVRRTSENWKSIKIFSDDGSEMRSHLTPTGLLFLTLSDETVDFEEFFPRLESLIAHVDFTNRHVRKSLRYIGHYNWKALVDGYQECLHCAYAHPEFSRRYTPTTYKVLNEHNYSQHLAKPDHSTSDGLFLYFFPNTTLNLYGGGMSLMHVCPQENPSTTMMEFDYYHDALLGSEEFETYYGFARKVGVEDHDLCERLQGNLELGVYSAGLLNPNKENGVAYYQRRVLEMCSAQLEKERQVKPSEQAAPVIERCQYTEAPTA